MTHTFCYALLHTQLSDLTKVCILFRRQICPGVEPRHWRVRGSVGWAHSRGDIDCVRPGGYVGKLRVGWDHPYLGHCSKRVHASAYRARRQRVRIRILLLWGIIINCCCLYIYVYLFSSEHMQRAHTDVYHAHVQLKWRCTCSQDVLRVLVKG